MNERLQRLFTKKDVVEIDGFGELKVKGMTVKDMSDILPLIEKKKNGEAILIILRNTLKYNFPDMEDAELDESINEVDSGVALKVFNKIQEMSGLSSGDTKKEEE